MVEFSFDLRPLFPQPIIRVGPQQLRPSSSGCKLSQILNVMGRLSARAQGLSQPVTVAESLTGNQVVYLIADMQSGMLTVTGLLKVGTKNLFLFDEKNHIQRNEATPAILDFYVHESRQRQGQGKRLFERMLASQGWKAVKCSVDRPSHKLTGFLAKHYGLVNAIPQPYHFVLYEGFFDDQAAGRGTQQVQEPNPRAPGAVRASRSSVADVMGVGSRISNRPVKSCLFQNHK